MIFLFKGVIFRFHEFHGSFQGSSSFFYKYGHVQRNLLANPGKIDFCLVSRTPKNACLAGAKDFMHFSQNNLESHFERQG